MKKLCLAAFVLAAVPMVSSAATINFAGYPDLTVLNGQNFGDGITFTGATILQCCQTDGSGTLNNAFFPPPADDGGNTDGVNVAFNSSGPLTLNFTSPVNSFSAAFTYNSGLTVTAFDSASLVIATKNGGCGASSSGGANFLGSGCGAPNEVVSINVAGIAKIVVTGGVGNNFTFDDVTFPGALNAGVPPPAVPEPGTIAMVLGGLGCLAVFGRRGRPATREPKLYQLPQPTRG